MHISKGINIIIFLCGFKYDNLHCLRDEIKTRKINFVPIIQNIHIIITLYNMSSRCPPSSALCGVHVYIIYYVNLYIGANRLI